MFIFINTKWYKMQQFFLITEKCSILWVCGKMIVTHEMGATGKSRHVTTEMYKKKIKPYNRGVFDGRVTIRKLMIGFSGLYFDIIFWPNIFFVLYSFKKSRWKTDPAGICRGLTAKEKWWKPFLYYVILFLWLGLSWCWSYTRRTKVLYYFHWDCFFFWW